MIVLAIGYLGYFRAFFSHLLMTWCNDHTVHYNTIMIQEPIHAQVNMQFVKIPLYMVKPIFTWSSM